MQHAIEHNRTEGPALAAGGLLSENVAFVERQQQRWTRRVSRHQHQLATRHQDTRACQRRPDFLAHSQHPRTVLTQSNISIMHQTSASGMIISRVSSYFPHPINFSSHLTDLSGLCQIRLDCCVIVASDLLYIYKSASVFKCPKVEHEFFFKRWTNLVINAVICRSICLPWWSVEQFISHRRYSASEDFSSQIQPATIDQKAQIQAHYVIDENLLIHWQAILHFSGTDY